MSKARSSDLNLRVTVEVGSLPPDTTPRPKSSAKARARAAGYTSAASSSVRAPDSQRHLARKKAWRPGPKFTPYLERVWEQLIKKQAPLLNPREYKIVESWDRLFWKLQIVRNYQRFFNYLANLKEKGVTDPEELYPFYIHSIWGRVGYFLQCFWAGKTNKIKTFAGQNVTPDNWKYYTTVGRPKILYKGQNPALILSKTPRQDVEDLEFDDSWEIPETDSDC